MASGKFALARFNKDGSRDSSFGENGLALGPAGTATSLDFQVSTDTWILAGRTQPSGTQGDDFVIARFTGDGALDTGFGNAGRVTVEIGNPIPTTDGADGVVAGDDAVYAVGYSTSLGPQERNTAAVRIFSDGPDEQPDGSLDPAFAQDGIFRGSPGGFSSAILQNGRLIAAGRAGQNLALTALTPAGAPDPTFGSGADWTATAAALPDGPRGLPDLTFGSQGSVVTDMGDKVDEASAVAVEGSGGAQKILIAGVSGEYSFSYAVARYQAAAGAEEVNLETTMASVPNPIEVGDKLVFTTTVRNHSTVHHAYGVVLRTELPAQADVV
ncbi:MAG: hypothetical protein ACRDIU_08960 [Actinomycetota bacterium]